MVGQERSRRHPPVRGKDIVREKARGAELAGAGGRMSFRLSTCVACVGWVEAGTNLVSKFAYLEASRSQRSVVPCRIRPAFKA